MRLFEEGMRNFIQKKFNSIISIKKSDNQIEEIVEAYKNSSQRTMVKYLENIVLQSLFDSDHLSMKHVSWLYFSL